MTMYFIHIDTAKCVNNFTDWMFDIGAALKFSDSLDFREWLDKYNKFPLSIYLDGATYEFKDRRELRFFMIGFEAGIDLRYE